MAIRDTFSMVVMLLAASALHSAEPAPRDAGSFDRKLVLAGRRIGELNSGLFSMNADGSLLTTVWELPKDSYGLYQRVSPEGNSLAVGVEVKGKGADLWIVTGGEPKKLTHDAVPVAWSDDGQRIAGFRQADSSTQNFIIDVQTKAEENLPLGNSETVDDWFPASELLCVRALHPDKTFEHPTLGTYPLREVFLMGVSGMPRVQLRDDPLHDDLWGRFSPDGREVSFFRRRHADGKVLHEVIVQGRDGKDPHKVLSFEDFKGDWQTFKPQGPVCWSRDGKQLAAMVIRSGYVPTAVAGEMVHELSSELLVLTLETGDVRRIDLKKLGLDIVVWIDWH
jgi:hypothetical protein